jgi:hypothetical protein
VNKSGGCRVAGWTICYVERRNRKSVDRLLVEKIIVVCETVIVRPSLQTRVSKDEPRNNITLAVLPQIHDLDLPSVEQVLGHP